LAAARARCARRPEAACQASVRRRIGRGEPRADVEALLSSFRWCNEGAHEVQPGSLVDQVRDAEKLARWLESQK
jgi:hypothetical protein